MELIAPVTAPVVEILRGPGATQLFESMIQRAKLNEVDIASGAVKGPILDFTIRDPRGGAPLRVSVEMFGNWQENEDGDGYYKLLALLNSKPVVVLYSFCTDMKGLQGTIADE